MFNKKIASILLENLIFDACVNSTVSMPYIESFCQLVDAGASVSEESFLELLSSRYSQCFFYYVNYNEIKVNNKVLLIIIYNDINEDIKDYVINYWFDKPNYFDTSDDKINFIHAVMEAYLTDDKYCQRLINIALQNDLMPQVIVQCIMKCRLYDKIDNRLVELIGNSNELRDELTIIYFTNRWAYNKDTGALDNFLDMPKINIYFNITENAVTINRLMNDNENIFEDARFLLKAINNV